MEPMRKCPEMRGSEALGAWHRQASYRPPLTTPRGRRGFPHCGKGTDRDHTRFRLKVTELAMAERQKTANSRKPATRKAPRKTARKTTARKVDTALRKS